MFPEIIYFSISIIFTLYVNKITLFNTTKNFEGIYNCLNRHELLIEKNSNKIDNILDKV